MKNQLAYRISLVLTVLLTAAAFVTLLGGLGGLIKGWGQAPLISLLPWKALALILMAGLNCTLRARLIAGHTA